MSERIWNWIGCAVLIALVFVQMDTWKQSHETNRFIEQLLDAVDDREAAQ